MWGRTQECPRRWFLSLQVACLTSQVGKRDKIKLIDFPKWRGYIGPLGPVEPFKVLEGSWRFPNLVQVCFHRYNSLNET